MKFTVQRVTTLCLACIKENLVLWFLSISLTFILKKDNGSHSVNPLSLKKKRKFPQYEILLKPSLKLQTKGRLVGARGAGRVMAPTDFDRSFNLISTRGDRLCPSHYCWPPRFFRLSYDPEREKKKCSQHLWWYVRGELFLFFWCVSGRSAHHISAGPPRFSDFPTTLRERKKM